LITNTKTPSRSRIGRARCYVAPYYLEYDRAWLGIGSVDTGFGKYIETGRGKDLRRVRLK